MWIGKDSPPQRELRAELQRRVLCHTSTGAMGVFWGRAGALLQPSDQQGPAGLTLSLDRFQSR